MSLHSRDRSQSSRSSPGGAGRLVARGSAENPANRFERLSLEPDGETLDADAAAEEGPAAPSPTRFYDDPSRALLAHNQSPDLGFDTSLNPYRGCEHGCTYCYARPMHEYLGFSAGLDFETRILVKRDAPALLRKAFSARRWKPRVVALGAATDPYQPVERRLRLTRGCLEVFAEFRNPVAIVTKGAGITRDLDLLRELADHRCVSANVSITTLDDRLRRLLEPRASSPRKRLEAVEALARAGIPVRVMVAPVIPGLTDHEIPRLVQAAADAGAGGARMLLLRLPHGVADLFEAWLERHFPERKAKVLGRIRTLRGGRLNDSRFHARFRGSGLYAEQLESIFALALRRAGLADVEPVAFSTAAFRRPPSPQLSLF